MANEANDLDARMRRALAAPCCRRGVLKAFSAALLGTALTGVGVRVPAGVVPTWGGAASAASLLAGPAGPVSGLAPGQTPSLLVYDTAQGLLAGDLQHAVTVDRVLHDLAAFPPSWSAVGVGTTNQPGRTGELIPDGTAADLRFWWADPSSSSQASVSDLGTNPPASGIEFPFLALGVAGAYTPLTWALDGVPDVHAWLKERLSGAAMPLAAIQVEGNFGPVMTTVSYNIPPTGIDTSTGYVGTQYFRFGSYVSGTWRMNGVYAAAAALQPVISTAGNPVHLHGYQPGPMLGGHIVSAACTSGIAKIWLLDDLVVQPAPLAPEAAGT